MAFDLEGGTADDLAGVVAGTAAIGVIWNNRLTPSQNVNPSWELRATGVVGGLLLVTALPIGAGTIVVLVYRLQLSQQATRILGTLAVAMTAVMALIFAGTLTWWISTAIHAPWFFGSFLPRASNSPAPLVMIVLTSVMLAGFVLAGFGTLRIVDSLSSVGAASGIAKRTEWSQGLCRKRIRQAASAQPATSGLQTARVSLTPRG